MVCKGFRECHAKNVKVKNCNECLTVSNESKPTVKEKSVSYTIENKNKQKSLTFRVDGSLIDGKDEIRCDYLMMFPDSLKAFYIELKSQGWSKALHQLENTYKLLHHNLNEYAPHLRAVLRGVPKIMAANAIKMETRIKKRYPNATLKVGWKITDEV